MRKSHMLYIEEEIRLYHKSLKEIERMRNDIITGTKQQCNDGSQRCGLSDPTGQLVAVLVEDKQIKRMEEVTKAITEVYNELEEHKQRLIRIRYWKRPQTLTWDGIALELNVSRSQAIRWRNGIVYAVGKRLGIS